MSLRATHQLTERLCGASLQSVSDCICWLWELVYQEFVSPTFLIFLYISLYYIPFSHHILVTKGLRYLDRVVVRYPIGNLGGFGVWLRSSKLQFIRCFLGYVQISQSHELCRLLLDTEARTTERKTLKQPCASVWGTNIKWCCTSDGKQLARLLDVVTLWFLRCCISNLYLQRGGVFVCFKSCLP